MWDERCMVDGEEKGEGGLQNGGKREEIEIGVRREGGVKEKKKKRGPGKYQLIVNWIVDSSFPQAAKKDIESIPPQKRCQESSIDAKYYT